MIKNSIVSTSDIRRTNRQNVLRVLRGGSAVTANEICEQTGLSHPTVMKALQDFCDAGIVHSIGFGNTTVRGGKKPEIFEFCDTRELLCLSVWPGEVIVTHCRLANEPHDLERFACNINTDINTLFDKLTTIVDEYLGRYGIEKTTLFGVAVNVSGTVDNDKRIVNYNIKAPAWGKNVSFDEWARRTFGENVVLYIDNAGKAAGRALLAESPEYNGKRLLTIFSAWNVSACMIDKGHVLNGRDSLIGEIGHMVVSDSTVETCVCGKRGCLESLVSISHVCKLLRERGLEVPEDIDFKRMFQLSTEGNRPCRAVSSYLAHYFAVVLHNLSLTYNQEEVVFQGDFAWADPYFDAALKREISEFVYYSYYNDKFSIHYDKRDLAILASKGDMDRLKNEYFSMADDVDKLRCEVLHDE